MPQVSAVMGPERRRRWRPEEKLAVLVEAFAPGVIVADVARQRDVATSLIYQWRRQALAAGEKIEVAVAIGSDPATYFCAAMPLPDDIDEMILAGFIR